jgi:hypothetical protein
MSIYILYLQIYNTLYAAKLEDLINQALHKRKIAHQDEEKKNGIEMTSDFVNLFRKSELFSSKNLYDQVVFH